MTVLRYARTGITTNVSPGEVDGLVGHGWTVVPASEPDTAPSADWTVAQLTEYADTHNVDLSGLSLKGEILSAVTA